MQDVAFQRRIPPRLTVWESWRTCVPTSFPIHSDGAGSYSVGSTLSGILRDSPGLDYSSSTKGLGFYLTGAFTGVLCSSVVLVDMGMITILARRLASIFNFELGRFWGVKEEAAEVIGKTWP